MSPTRPSRARPLAQSGGPGSHAPNCLRQFSHTCTSRDLPWISRLTVSEVMRMNFTSRHHNQSDHWIIPTLFMLSQNPCCRDLQSKFFSQTTTIWLW
ncbi:hypothetical protein BS47DRAFT_331727 [Hydnum rufescens UP504]|uniref:Uncharacterized protein n=1 Tax=Hydnum rufescens UP504 TaxID=1448309 RepID=A0A9P6E0U3_9AGAM|nr:hypothetical protein BS47DRAFT_331727 [Hydnum rufescens UP504]